MILKIINSINTCYNQQLDLNNKLKKNVENIMINIQESSWYYFDRIKSKESFALKIETGRFNSMELEDFFACTLVVENSKSIKKATDLIKEHFVIKSRRPKSNDFTHKHPHSFPFDNLRLYATLKINEYMPPEEGINKICDIIFEIQIKTFLQHAWDISIHDLIYKGDDIDWRMQRVAYQIKAMLEHAEMSIHDIDKIKESDILPKKDKYINDLNTVKEFLKKNWTDEFLSKDIIRMSKNVSQLLEQLDVGIKELQELLDKETNSGYGRKTLNLSPYFIILQTVINRNSEKIKKFMQVDSKYKIPIPSEIDTKELTLKESKAIYF